MAKKTTVAKKNKKTSGAKVKKTTKKTSTKKKPTVKTSAKKTTKKKPVTKKIVAKKIATKKTTEKKSKSPQVMHHETSVQKPKQQKVVAKPKKEVVTEDEFSAAERRAKALKKIKGYGKKELDHFRDLILEKRDEIIEQLQNLKEQMLDPTTGEYINENSPYSLHMAEQGTDAMEREKTFLYAQRENKFLGYLEDALKRIENGTYGICVECIEEPQNLCETCPLIPKERLFAVPHSQHCLPIKQRQERK
jgi:RNA polymerase-binding transcription factor